MTLGKQLGELTGLSKTPVDSYLVQLICAVESANFDADNILSTSDVVDRAIKLLKTMYKRLEEEE